HRTRSSPASLNPSWEHNLRQTSLYAPTSRGYQGRGPWLVGLAETRTTERRRPSIATPRAPADLVSPRPADGRSQIREGGGRSGQPRASPPSCRSDKLALVRCASPGRGHGVPQGMRATLSRCSDTLWIGASPLSTPLTLMAPASARR